MPGKTGIAMLKPTEDHDVLVKNILDNHQVMFKSFRWIVQPKSIELIINLHSGARQVVELAPWELKYPAIIYERVESRMAEK
jgi:hypothetical protein